MLRVAHVLRVETAIMDQQARRPFVLIVDDEPTILSVLAEVLRSSGYEVIEASNGRLAVDVLDRQTVDLVITDACMPELGGRGLYEHIKKHHPSLVDRIIVITGHLRDDSEFFQTSTELPILYKPFAVQALLDAIRNVLD
jgi:DNA-binding NtrC family response regulator